MFTHVNLNEYAEADMSKLSASSPAVKAEKTIGLGADLALASVKAAHLIGGRGWREQVTQQSVCTIGL